ncbi:MAG: glycosyltransferase [Eubacteriales bacterium]|nr:glycosyltransferase [Eubacteriales bacterium]
MKISVALAYYNGGNYIKEQLDSILKQLGERDEVILSVDGAEDGSLSMLEEWQEKDARLKVIRGPGRGVVSNFAHALSQCEGDIIFLADQDDIWKKDKVKKVRKTMVQTRVMAVLHDASIIDGEGNPTEAPTLFESRNSGPGILKNWWKNSYVGCCMAFRKELLSVVLPIPNMMYMHDYWIGTAAEYVGRVAFLSEPLIDYRRHDHNVTEMHRGSLFFMIKKRLRILLCLPLLKRRAGKWRAEHLEKKKRFC